MVSRDAVEISNAALSVLGGLIQFPSKSGCLRLGRDISCRGERGDAWSQSQGAAGARCVVGRAFRLPGWVLQTRRAARPEATPYRRCRAKLQICRRLWGRVNGANLTQIWGCGGGGALCCWAGVFARRGGFCKHGARRVRRPRVAARETAARQLRRRSRVGTLRIK
jgi:hypothetical protein